MTASTLAVKDASGATQQLVTDLLDGKHTPLHHDADRPELLAALASILGSVDGLEALLSGDLSVTAAALPLPAGAATQATLASILAKLIAAPSTEAKQDTIIGFVDGIETALAAVLAALQGNLAVTGPLTNAQLGAAGLATQTTAAAILAKLTADPATQTTLAAVLSKITASAATETKQDAIKTSLDALTSAIKPITGHFLVVPSGSALANTTRRIVAGAAGTLTCTVGGSSVSYTVTAGQALDVAATIISAAPAGTVGQY